MTVSFGAVAYDYARYRADFPEETFRRLRAMGVGLPGQRVLDVGTGTGALARGFARTGCVVTGLDPDRALLDQARRLDAEAGVAISYRVGRAEDTGLESSAWDVVSAGQCWHWFDRPHAAAEVRRLLAPGGALVICHLGYLALHGNVCAATEALVRKHNPAWEMHGSTGIYPAWTLDVAGAGLTDLETFSFDVVISYTHEAWRGRMRTCSGVGPSLSAPAVAAFDNDLGQLLAEQFPQEPLAVPHRMWALVARAPGC